MFLAGLAVWLVAAWLFPAGHAPAATPGASGDPFVYLFDTGKAASEPVPGRAVADRSGWSRLEEDDLTHRFAGDVAMGNDRLTVILRRVGPGAEVYSRSATGWRRRAVLVPLSIAGSALTGWTSVKTVENQPGGAVVEITHRTNARHSVRARYRLTTGRAVVEVAPLDGADRLVVWTFPQFIVVPGFLGDDMVFAPLAGGRPRIGLPTEQLLLHMLAGGEAMAMCVWSDGSQPADALIRGTGPNRRLRGCEIRCARDRPLWVALFEGTGLWHRQPANADASDTTTAWKPPFPARWRRDLLEDDGFARSREPADAAALVAPASEPVLVYPIDRDRETPLSTFTPGDVLRDTLGVGPCQYVLQCERLTDSATTTPDNAADYVTRQLRKSKAKRDVEQIRRQLAAAVEQVRQAQARIQEYADFAVELKALLGVPGSSEGVPGPLEELARTLTRLQQITAPPTDSDDGPEECRRLADGILALAEADDPLPEFEPLGTKLRELGARRNRALADCRMTVRWLRQQARATASGDTSAAATAREIATRAERLLSHQ